MMCRDFRIPRCAQLALLAGVLVAFGCQPKVEVDPQTQLQMIREPEAGPVEDRQNSTLIRFQSLSEDCGVSFKHQTGAQGDFHLAEAMTGGVALFDFDNNGSEDIYFCTGENLTESAIENGLGNATGVLFSNQGHLKFFDATKGAGLERGRYCLGVTTGDYDNDGFADLYLSKWGPSQLLHNNGDGTFSDATTELLARGDRFGAGVCFADLNADSTLDLVVGNYVKLPRFDTAHNQAPTKRSKYPGPLDFAAESNNVFLNQNNSDWIDASLSSGLGKSVGTAMGIVCGDFDDDGDCDIYVANDEMPNFMFTNDGTGVFSEVGYPMGVAVDNQGRVNGSMGVDCADVDNDGFPDLVVTSFANELVTLYQMRSHGAFEDGTHSSRLGLGTAPHVTWGCCIGDLDNDGDRDIYVASGHFDSTSAYHRVTDLIFENQLPEIGRPRFSLISEVCGDVAKIKESSRGAAISDLDGDGDLDVVVLNSQARCTILENTTLIKNNWLEIQLIGTRTNRSAIGARITYRQDRLVLHDEVRGGRGYQSYWGERIHFGLGQHSAIGTVEIRWPDGSRQQVNDVQPNQLLQVIQQP